MGHVVMSFTTYLQNMTLFLNKITMSKINFLYFHANDLSKPKVKDTFRTFNVNTVPCYIIPGFHIYKESTIKYLTKTISQGPSYRNVQIVNANPVNLGNHIDLGILNLRNQADVVVKTHKTVYRDLGGFVFDRDAYICNFLMSQADISNVGKFEKTNCVRSDNSVCGVLDNVYNNSEDIAIIYHLLQVMVGNIRYGGRKKKLRGGSIKDDAFIEFLTSNIIRPLSHYRSNIEDIRVIDDDSRSTSSIAVVVNLIDDATIIIRLDKQRLYDDGYIHELKNDIDSLCKELDAMLSDEYKVFS
jgi:hypothetical protein